MVCEDRERERVCECVYKNMLYAHRLGGLAVRKRTTLIIAVLLIDVLWVNNIYNAFAYLTLRNSWFKVWFSNPPAKCTGPACIYTYLVKRVLLLLEDVSFVLFITALWQCKFWIEKKKRISLPGGGSSSYKRPPAKSSKALAEVGGRQVILEISPELPIPPLAVNKLSRSTKSNWDYVSTLSFPHYPTSPGRLVSVGP